MTETTTKDAEKARKEAPETSKTATETPKEAPKATKTGPDVSKMHLGYTAQVVVTPTFDTDTGKRLNNNEFMEYKCTECDWGVQVKDAGMAGNQIILHALGMDNLNIEFLDFKDMAANSTFDVNNPTEVLKEIGRQQALAETQE